MQHRTGLLIAPLEGAGDSGIPLYVRVFNRIRDAIFSGSVGAGERLPSERTLAADLQVSRTTVEAAYRRLAAEGYVDRHVGSGSYVRSRFPERVAAAMEAAARARAGAGTERVRLSRRGERLARAGTGLVTGTVPMFSSCVPGLDSFPSAVWNRLAAQRLRSAGASLLTRAAPAGVRLLREAIASHVAAARGVRCNWRQVLVLASTQQALDLSARLLLDEGDAVWLEEPGYTGARAAFAAGGARIVPVPVDADGMDVAAGRAAAPHAKLAYVTPSRQFPLGSRLSLARRASLVQWAAASGAWIFEDDYDSEFQPGRQPLVALQGLDEGHRVLYAATFNKVLFPGLRLAYCVVPEPVVEDFALARNVVDGGQSAFLQVVLADFIADGHFAAHVRRMRAVYAERRDVFLAASRAHLDGIIRVGSLEGAFQTVLWLPAGADEAAVSAAALRMGLDLPPLSRFRLEPSGAPGLMLTYGGEPPERIEAGTKQLAAILETTLRREAVAA
jgi:GntR family transcriptional regulator/MocR family aminotransferase